MAIFAIFGRKIWEAACPVFIFANTVVQKGLHYGNLSFAPCPIINFTSDRIFHFKNHFKWEG